MSVVGAYRCCSAVRGGITVSETAMATDKDGKRTAAMGRVVLGAAVGINAGRGETATAAVAFSYAIDWCCTCCWCMAAPPAVDVAVLAGAYGCRMEVTVRSVAHLHPSQSSMGAPSNNDIAGDN